jgi:hypothetical protein
MRLNTCEIPILYLYSVVDDSYIGRSLIEISLGQKVCIGIDLFAKSEESD